jgi:hypothetical protein
MENVASNIKDLYCQSAGEQQNFIADSFVLEKEFYVDELLANSCFKHFGWLAKEVNTFNRSSRTERNAFAISNALSIGGGEVDGLHSSFKYVRFGGGSLDSRHYLKKFKKEVDDITTDPGDDEIVIKSLGLEPNILEPLSLEFVKTFVPVNSNANSGPSYSAFGMKNKREAFLVAYEVAEKKIEMCKEGITPPPFLYGLAGRSKLVPLEKCAQKLLNGDSVGRGVWMADTDEFILSTIFTRVFYEYIKNRGSSLLGFNKYSSDANELKQKLNLYNLFIGSDYSSYDSTLIRCLLRLAFRVMKRSFKLTEWQSRLFDYLADQFINTVVVLQDGSIIIKDTGNPSGSTWVSLVNTVVNVLLVEKSIKYWFKKIGRTIPYYFKVYCDDSLISFLTKGNEKNRMDLGKDFLNTMIIYLKERFRITVSPEDSKVFIDLCIKVVSPSVPVKILDGSRAVLQSYNNYKMKCFGRRLRFWDIYVEIYAEPSAGLKKARTHRWQFKFGDSPSILSYYFREDGYMCRPTFEVLCRIINCSKKVSTLDEHEAILMCALVENLNNKHTINHVMHWLYDCYYLRRMGVLTVKELKPILKRQWFKYEHRANADPLPYEDDQNTRGWYRNQLKKVNLHEDIRSKDFIERFIKICQLARETYSNLNDDSYLLHKIRTQNLLSVEVPTEELPFYDVRKLRVYTGFVALMKMLHGNSLSDAVPKYALSKSPLNQVPIDVADRIIKQNFIIRGSFEEFINNKFEGKG